MKKEYDNPREIELKRSDFRTNTLGEDEFDFVLGDLGVPSTEVDKVDFITLRVVEIDY